MIYLDIKKASTGIYYLGLVEVERADNRWSMSVSYRVTRVVFQGIDPVPTDMPVFSVGQTFENSAHERVWNDSSLAFREAVRSVFSFGLVPGFAEML